MHVCACARRDGDDSYASRHYCVFTATPLIKFKGSGARLTDGGMKRLRR